MSLTKTPASLVEASRVTRLDSHTYRAHLHQAYCVAAGEYPNLELMML